MRCLLALTVCLILAGCCKDEKKHSAKHQYPTEEELLEPKNYGIPKD